MSAPVTKDRPLEGGGQAKSASSPPITPPASQKSQATAAYGPPRDAREQLIVEHIGMARRIARHIGRRADDATRADLESTAMEGLVEAAKRYDFTRSEPFPAFAFQRVRGAVIDSLRQNDIVPRRVRSMAKKAGAAIVSLEHELGRAPEDEEVAARLELSIEDYLAQIAAVAEVSFVELVQEHEEEIADGTERSDPAQQIERAEVKRMVRAGLGKLEPRDGKLLMLYYVEELTYSEIARMLGISQPRVCQIHQRALVRLRAVMEGEK